MSLSIENKYIQPLSARVYRIAESQLMVATNTLVDTVEEQQLLEEMLDRVKPNVPQECKKFDYLIYTPFRYPPLKHGSRFGKKIHPSIFYGSTKIETTFAEMAYYRFVYYDGMQTPPKKQQKVTQHTTFYINAKTNKGLALTKPPFGKYKNKISDPTAYAASQALGEDMRDKGVEVFNYFSARAENEINVGLFTCKAIVSKAPKEKQHWSCITKKTNVTIRSLDDSWKNYSFNLKQFLIDGVLPIPAC